MTHRTAAGAPRGDAALATTAPPVIAIVGPTAAGKSDLALDLADRLGGPERVEIIGADAFQLYRGMDIGTAKLPTSERRGYIHHQIDVLEPSQDASVAQYQAAARADIAAARQRGRRVIVVGGSGLYVRALLDDIEFPGTDPAIREAYELRAAAEGTAALVAELARADPAAAAAIDPANTRRVIRALEVIAITGEPFSANLPRQQYAQPAVQIGIDYGRAELDARIEARVDAMLRAGLVAEVDTLASSDSTGLSRTALRAVGYREIADFRAGDISLDEARARIVTATRRLARKQMGWFGRDPRITWLRTDGGPNADIVDSMVAIVCDADTDPAATMVARHGAVASAHEPVRRRLGT